MFLRAHLTKKETNKEIKIFCEAKFGISFPMTEKVKVIGNDAHDFLNGLNKITEKLNSKMELS